MFCSGLTTPTSNKKQVREIKIGNCTDTILWIISLEGRNFSLCVTVLLYTITTGIFLLKSFFRYLKVKIGLKISTKQTNKQTKKKQQQQIPRSSRRLDKLIARQYY